MALMSAGDNYKRLREEIPEQVTIVVAAKQRTPQEIRQVIAAGATDIGENYVQEAKALYSALGEEARLVKWHMIGDLQENKINRALNIFNMIQTVDSIKKAEAIDKRADTAGIDRIDCLIEINIGSEISKAGARPEYNVIKDIARKSSELSHLRLKGLMTIGPLFGDPEDTCAYFRKVKNMSDRIKNLDLPNVVMETLSMGMSHSYKVAIEEGANMVRIGTAIFGERV